MAKNKPWQKGLAVMLTVLMVCTGVLAFPATAESSEISLYMNGVQRYPDVAPVLQDNRTMVPVRYIAETLGADVHWYGSERKVSIHKDEKTILLYIDSPLVTVDGKESTLDTSPFILNNRTMVPIRFVSETLGAKVDWVQSERAVYVTDLRLNTLSVELTEEDNKRVFMIKTSQNAAFERIETEEKERVLIRVENVVLNTSGQTVSVGKNGVSGYTLSQEADGSAWVDIELLKGQIVKEEVFSDRYLLHLPLPIGEVAFGSYQGVDAVRLQADGSPGISLFALTSPHRAVMDIDSAYLLNSGGSFAVDHDYIEQVRYAQHDPDTVRVVVDLTRPAATFTARENGSIYLLLAPDIEQINIKEDSAGGELTVFSSGSMEVSSSQQDKKTSLLIPYARWSEGLSVTVEVEGKNQTVHTAADIEKTLEVGGAVIKSIKGSSQEAGISLEITWTEEAKDREVRQPNRQEVIVKAGREDPPPLTGRVIVIDPGHGGYDTGAVGPTGLREKEVVLAVGLMMRDLLVEQGAEVVMTRDRDVYLTLSDRVALAHQVRADVFVSVHANGFENPAAHGTSTHYMDNHQDSRPLAQLVHSHMLSEVERRDRGVKISNFHVLRETNMPSCLVEIAFVTNPEEEALLKTTAFREKAARGIVQGLMVFFDQHR